MARKMEKRKQNLAKLRGLLLYFNPYSRVAEEYRSARTNLYFLMKKKESKSLLVTSTKRGEGKTTSVTNLAISMAKANEKVLIVDANFRNPSIHKFFNLSNQHGFLELLKEKMSYEEAISQTYIPNLDVLTSGELNGNSLEVINSQKIITALDEYSKMYDRIIIDAPPVLEAAEVRFLASKSDGVILIVGQNGTKIEEFEKAKRALEVAKANLLGVILNEKSRFKPEGYFF